MNTKLLSWVLITILFSSFSWAQTKTWDFGNDTTTWPLSSGIGNNAIVVDNLGLYPIPTNTNFGAVNASAATFSDGFTAVNRFQLNGAGYSTSGGFVAMPTQRYLFLGIDGACTVKLWFKTGSNGSVRTMFVTDGTNTVGSATSNANGNADLVILETSYTGGAGTLYLYGDASCNLYKLEVTGANVSTTLSTQEESLLPTNLFSNGNQVFVNDVITPTQINIYSTNGVLVKSLNTADDISFTLEKSGFYIAQLSSNEGQKTVKLLTY